MIKRYIGVKEISVLPFRPHPPGSLRASSEFRLPAKLHDKTILANSWAFLSRAVPRLV